MKQLKPVGAKAAATQRDPASLVRDQLWAIINERYEELRQAGAVVFGLKNLDEHIPPLGARAATTTAAAAAAKKSNGAGAKGATTAGDQNVGVFPATKSPVAWLPASRLGLA